MLLSINYIRNACHAGLPALPDRQATSADHVLRIAGLEGDEILARDLEDPANRLARIERGVRGYHDVA